MSAGVAAVEGDADTARAWVDDLKTDGFAAIQLTEIASTALLVLTADAVAFVGDADAAASLIEILGPYSGRLSWSGLCTHTPIDQTLAALHAVLGNDDQAAHHQAIADEITTRLAGSLVAS